MTTVRNRAYPATADANLDVQGIPADGQFDQLRDFVDRAAQGEIDLELGHQAEAPSADGRLPSAWYAKPPDAPTPPLFQRTRLRPEAMAGLLGLGAGLVLLLPLALWWQQASIAVVPTVPFATSFAPDTGHSKADGHVDLVSVRSVPVTAAPAVSAATDDETFAEARTLLADGEVLAARGLLSKVVAARHPDGLFLMAETYDPNILAARRARGVGADTERARALYTAAHNLGHARAAARLSALQ